MANFTLGKYLPYKSCVHNMDPRAKIVVMILLLIAIFIPAGFLGYGILIIIVSLILFVSKLNFKFIIKSMRPMLLMLVFLLIINILVIKTGVILFSFFSFNVHLDAIIQTVYIAIRLLLMIMITTCLTATTKPLDLTLGIEDLLKPLKVIKVPANEIAMMISISLRFIPTLIEETERIMKAQASRGVDLKEGKIKEKIGGILSLIVPLFVSSFQRAEELANAMEARGYAPGEIRTRYKQLKMKCFDYCALFFGVLIICIMSFISVSI